MPEIDPVIELIGHLFAKYSFLITGQGWATTTPAIQHNWMAIFNVPWNGSPPPERRRQA